MTVRQSNVTVLQKQAEAELKSVIVRLNEFASTATSHFKRLLLFHTRVLRVITSTKQQKIMQIVNVNRELSEIFLGLP